MTDLSPLKTDWSCKKTAELLVALNSKIVQLWVDRARKEVFAAGKQDELSLINSIPEFLDRLAQTLTAPSTKTSKANNAEVAIEHADERAALTAYTLNQVIYEYQVLREVLGEVLEAAHPLSSPARRIIHRYIDSGIRIAAVRFTEIGKRETKAAMDQLNRALESGDMATWHVNLKTNEIITSAGMTKMFGEDIRDNVMDVINKRIPLEDRTDLKRALAKAIQDGKPYTHEHRMIGPDGSMRWILVRGGTDRDNQGHPITFSGVNADITERKLAENRLKIEHEELREFVMQAPIPMLLMLGPEHRVSIANQPYETFVKGNTVGKTAYEVLNPEERELLIPKLDQVFRTGTPYFGTEIPRRLMDTDGTTREQIVNIGYNPFRDLDGNIKGVSAFIQNVTEQSRARRVIEEGKANFQEIANAMPQIVFTATPKGFIDWHNKRWDDYVGTNFSGNIQEPGSPVHPDDDDRTWRHWQQSIATGQDYEIEYRLRRGSDQQYRWHLGRATPIRNDRGEITKWIGSNTDIHDLKLIRQSLESVQGELVDAKVIAEAANVSKSAFLANMSHEIRTPLGVMLGFGELLKDPRITKAEHDLYVGKIIRNGTIVTKLVDNLLDLAKVEAGCIVIEEIVFSLRDLMIEIIDFFQDAADKKSILLTLELSKDVPARICSDPTRLRQIMMNLVGNALKFTDKGEIKVTVGSQQGPLGHLQITLTVKDSGIGMTTPQKEKLFRPFIQADDSTTRRFGGTGLGLALSRGLSQVLGGNLTVGVDPQELGSTFTLTISATLPRTTDANGLSCLHADALALPDIKNLRVLIVDDSQDNLFLMQQLLISHGAIAETANSGLEAYGMGQVNHYDIVLMDIQMPGMDGYQTRKALSDQGFNNPIVALTAHAMNEEREKTRMAGFAAHLTKPVNMTELLTTVADLCHRVRH